MSKVKKTPGMIALDRRIELEVEKKIINLLNNDNFYYWLNEFTEEMPILTDVEDLEISNFNMKKVQSLYVFYEMIKKYANQKGISANKFNERIGLYYSIVNYGQPYEIGVTDLNNKLIHFCCRCNKDEVTQFIDIKDIRNEYYMKKQKDLEELKHLKEQVIHLLDNGVTSEDILSFVNKGIEEGKKCQHVKFYRNIH